MEVKTIPFSKCTKDFLKTNFSLKKLWESSQLDQWLNMAADIVLDDVETEVLKRLQRTLVRRIDDWNEMELSEYFIGPLIALIDYNTDYFSVFIDRTISAIIGDYELTGKPDFMIAEGESEPRVPYFCFQEYKRQIDPDGNPVYQVLAEMLVAQKLNPDGQNTIYGVAVIGDKWYFLILMDKEYCVSKGFLADDEELFYIFKVLKALKLICIRNIEK